MKSKEDIKLIIITVLITLMIGLMAGVGMYGHYQQKHNKEYYQP